MHWPEVSTPLTLYVRRPRADTDSLDPNEYGAFLADLKRKCVGADGLFPHVGGKLSDTSNPFAAPERGELRRHPNAPGGADGLGGDGAGGRGGYGGGRGLPPGARVGPGGILLDASGNPILGADGKPLMYTDPRIPPGGSVGPPPDCLLLDASGNPVLGADGKPLRANLGDGFGNGVGPWGDGDGDGGGKWASDGDWKYSGNGIFDSIAGFNGGFVKPSTPSASWERNNVRQASLHCGGNRIAAAAASRRRPHLAPPTCTRLSARSPRILPFLLSLSLSLSPPLFALLLCSSAIRLLSLFLPSSTLPPTTRRATQLTHTAYARRSRNPSGRPRRHHAPSPRSK